MASSEFSFWIFFVYQLDQANLKLDCVNMNNIMRIISTKKNNDSLLKKNYFLWSCSCHLQINSIIPFNLICKIFNLNMSIYFLQ